MAERDEVLRLRDRMHVVENKLTAQALDHEMLKEIHARLIDVEKKLDKRDGAIGVFGAIWRSPLLGWIGATALAVWAMLTGKTG